MPIHPLNILFLPRWYPHRYDPMPGLFIQRQAEALATRHHVVVLYVHPDPGCPSEFEIDFAEENGVTVVRVYYKIPEIVLPGIYQALTIASFYRAHQRGLEVVGDFIPDVIHSHVLTRTAMIGHYLSRRYRVPHVISEHWSRYFAGNLSYRGWLRKWFTKYLVRKADTIIPVSEVLHRAMVSWRLVNDRYVVIPNIVDPISIPDYPEKREDHRERPAARRQILHVSCFDDRAKNISGLLDSLLELSKKRSDFQCLLVGTGPDLKEMQHRATELGLLGTTVFFPGLKDQHELAILYEQSDFTVLSSRYETFGTVVIESLACGTPVLSTAVGIAPEVITAENGILIPVNDRQALTEGLDRMLDRCDSYERKLVRASVPQRFTCESVANQLSSVYSQIRGDV
ncbi:MAG: glycosyltransferase family 4 protein [Bacteroidetes bacterium]|nr:MAG: glycosyltransferase family 4 protein [Bacteroidota bacterium]